MTRRTLMQKFARWHIWLGWAAAVPLILWTLSGLFMVLRPIEEVRGEHLRRPVPPIAPQVLVAPRLATAVSKMTLVQQDGRPVWLVTHADKAQRRYSADSGAAIGPVDVIEARRLAEAAIASPDAITQVRRFSADAPPSDLRKPRPSWQVHYDDGTHLYLDADTGEVLAVRTRWWRMFDFMWGLHILDPIERESSSHPLLWIFATAGLMTCLIGTTLLFRRRRARPAR